MRGVVGSAECPRKVSFAAVGAIRDGSVGNSAVCSELNPQAPAHPTIPVKGSGFADFGLWSLELSHGTETTCVSYRDRHFDASAAQIALGSCYGGFLGA